MNNIHALNVNSQENKLRRNKMFACSYVNSTQDK